MKTLKQVIAENRINPTIVRAVVRQLGGTESMPDIYNHGISGGFTGFIYYIDTVKFYKRHRAKIVAMLEELAEDLGGDVISLVEGFNCLKISSSEHYSSSYTREQHKRDLRGEVVRTLYGRIKEDDTQVANALAWFAAEEVARAFCEE